MFNNILLRRHREIVLVDDDSAWMTHTRNDVLDVSEVFLDVARGDDGNVEDLTQLSQSLCIMSHRMAHHNMLGELFLDVAFKENAVGGCQAPNSLHIFKINYIQISFEFSKMILSTK